MTVVVGQGARAKISTRGSSAAVQPRCWCCVNTFDESGLDHLTSLCSVSGWPYRAMDRVPEGAQTDSMAPPPRRHAEWEDTMWWMVLGIVLILLIVCRWKGSAAPRATQPWMTAT